jgi:hypothetical protein
MKIIIATTLILAASFVQVAAAASRTISSYTEATGNQHPGTAAVGGPAQVTCTFVAGTNATCYIVGPGVANQVPKGGQVGTSGAGTVTLTCNGNGALRCQARIDGPVAAERKAAIAPKVQDFIKPLEGHETASGSIPDFYFRKETLQVNGALIIGNGGPNFYQSACTTDNKVALVLAKIDHFDDLGPCPSGGTLVRAVLK